MEINWRTAKTTTAVIAIAICSVLILQGFTVNAGVSENTPLSTSNPHAVTGHVYWSNGSLEDTIAIPVSVTNNRTGETGIVMVDVVAGGNPDGTYQIDLSNSLFYPSGYVSTDIIFVNCTYQNMWAKNETTAAGPFSPCDLHLVELPLGPELVTLALGASIIGFNSTVTLDIPSGSLTSDAIIYGTQTEFSRPGSLLSINLGPDGTTFSPPATLSWSYAGLDLGALSPQSLKVFTSDGELWEMLPTVVDTQNQLLIVEVSHFSSFSMGSANIVGLQTDVNYTYPGTLNVPILDLAITDTDLVTGDMLDYIHVVSNCTDDLDVAGVSIWNDTNDNAIIDGSDVQLNITQVLVGGNTNFTGIGEIIPANTTLNVLVALDVSAAAIIDDYLDLLIPINGVGLANAGLNTEAVDPADNTTIAQELTDPHVVYGYISNMFGNVSGAWVNLTNNRTGSTENLMADTHGRYDVNLGLMLGGYMDNDTIFIMANDTLGQSGWNTTKVNVSHFGERCNVSFGSGPVASDEIPSNGSVIANLTQNVMVNITATAFSLNITTIVLEINGINYSWPDPALSYVGNTLIFDTSTAVGSWSTGQIVNVTLWVANDTVGNPCLNAPYAWTFGIFTTLNPAKGLWVEKDHADGSMAGDITLHWTDTNSGSIAYEIFTSIDKFGFNFTAPNATTGLGDTSWVHVGANGDNKNWFYIVRPVGGTVNSTMGFKYITTLEAQAGYTRVNWVMLPWNSSYYRDAFSIVNEIEGPHADGLYHSGDDGENITAISRWNSHTQGVGSKAYYSSGPIPPANWYNNYIINPGDGIGVTLQDKGMDWSYNWVINGTDTVDTITLEAQSSYTRLNWISLPVTSIYSSSFDIVDDIEGPHVDGLYHSGDDGENITAISRWNPHTQGVGSKAYYSAGPIPPANWYNNYAIVPGDGIGITLQDKGIDWTYSWIIKLLTPEI